MQRLVWAACLLRAPRPPPRFPTPATAVRRVRWLVQTGTRLRRRSARLRRYRVRGRPPPPVLLILAVAVLSSPARRRRGRRHRKGFVAAPPRACDEDPADGPHTDLFSGGGIVASPAIRSATRPTLLLLDQRASCAEIPRTLLAAGSRVHPVPASGPLLRTACLAPGPASPGPPRSPLLGAANRSRARIGTPRAWTVESTRRRKLLATGRRPGAHGPAFVHGRVLRRRGAPAHPGIGSSAAARRRDRRPPPAVTSPLETGSPCHCVRPWVPQSVSHGSRPLSADYGACLASRRRRSGGKPSGRIMTRPLDAASVRPALHASRHDPTRRGALRRQRGRFGRRTSM